MSKGGGGTNTVTNSAPPPEVLAAYQDVIGKAQNAAASPLQQYNGQIVAGFTPDQTSAISTINNSQGIANPYINTANGLYGDTALSGQDYGKALQDYTSPYTQQVVDATRANLNENDAQQQLGLAGNAIKAGAYGGDRAGIASAELARQQKLANDQTIAGLYNTGYTNAQGALAQQQGLKQNAASGIAGLGNLAQTTTLNGANAQLQSGALQQQLEQENLNVPYQQFQAEQQYPFQTTQYLANIAEGIGGSSGGTSTSNAPGPSVGSQLGGLGLAGLSLAGALKRDGGAVGYANGGDVVPGQSNLPQVPDVSVSIVPVGKAPGNRNPFGGIPKAESSKTTTPSNPMNDAISNGLGAANIYKGSQKIGGGISNLYNSWMGSPVLPDNTAFGTAGNSMVSNVLTPAGDVSAISPSIVEGANLAGMTSGAEGLGGIASASLAPTASSTLMPAFADAATNAGLTTAATDTGVASFLESVPEIMAAFALKRGGAVRKFADGGDISDDDLDDDTGTGSGISPTYFKGLIGAMPSSDDGSGIALPIGRKKSNSDDYAPDLSQSVLATGLAMMAGTSPYAGVNIGNAGLVGVKNWNEQKQTQERAQQLAEQVDRWKQQFEEKANYHNSLVNRGVGELDAVAKKLMMDNSNLTPTQAYVQANGLIHGSGKVASMMQSSAPSGLAKAPVVSMVPNDAGSIPLATLMKGDGQPQDNGDFLKTVAPEGSTGSAGVITLPLNDEGTEFKPNKYASLNGSNGTIADAVKAPIPAQLSGDQFLSTLDPHTASVVKLIGDNKEKSSTILSRMSPDEKKEIMSAVSQYNPDYNARSFGNISKFETGKEAQTIRSFNATSSHIETLNQAIDALNNGDIPLFNKVANEYSKQTGNPAPTDFNAVKQLAAAEIVKSVVGGQGALGDRETAEESLKLAASPAQLKGITNHYAQLIGGQMGAMRNEYEAATGKKDFDKYLTPSTKKLLELSSEKSSKKIATMADIAETARKTGKTVDQVTKDAQAKGYTIQ